MTPETPDNLDALLASAFQARPEHRPAIDLAAEARLRAVGHGVPASLVRWSRLMRWCSVLGIVLIVGVIAVGGYGLLNAGVTQQASSTDETQAVLVEVRSTTSMLTIDTLGIGLLGLVLVGITLSAAFASPAPRFEAGAR